MKSTFVNFLIILLLIALGAYAGYTLAVHFDDDSALYSEIDSLYAVIRARMQEVAAGRIRIDSLQARSARIDTLIQTEIKYIDRLPSLTTDSLARLTALTYRTAHPEDPMPAVMASGTRLLIDRAIAIDYIGVRRSSVFLKEQEDLAWKTVNEYRSISYSQDEVIKNYQVINGNFERIVVRLSKDKELLQSALFGTTTTAILLGFNVREGSALGAGAGVFILSYNFNRIKKIVGFIF